MDIPTVALILELLNSQENCSSESQKVSLLQLQRLLSFSWICSDKSYNFPFPHGEAEGGLKMHAAAESEGADPEVWTAEARALWLSFSQLC